MDSVISVRELEKRYKNGVQALKGISFDIRKGETFGLLGPNGAGKSTTIGILTTLVTPTSGEARVFGFDVKTSALDIKQRIGVVPQERWLDEDVTARENLLLHGEYYGMPKAAAVAAAERVLHMMELAQRADDLLYTYSGGMLQRLLIARALMHEPELLVMDEPTIGLDPQARRAMWGYIRELKSRGVTILLTTHYMDEADKLCDRLAVIDEGKLQAMGTPAELKALLPGATAIEAEVSAVPDELLKSLQGMKGVEKVEQRDHTLTIFVSDGKHILPAVSAAIQKHTRLSAISMHEPTLEDVYIQLTGKELRE